MPIPLMPDTLGEQNDYLVNHYHKGKAEALAYRNHLLRKKAELEQKAKSEYGGGVTYRSKIKNMEDELIENEKNMKAYDLGKNRLYEEMEMNLTRPYLPERHIGKPH